MPLSWTRQYLLHYFNLILNVSICRLIHIATDYLCVVCAFSHVWVYVYMSAHMYRGQSLTSMFSLTTLYHQYWGKMSHLNPGLANSASLAGWFALGSSCLYFLNTEIRQATMSVPYLPGCQILGPKYWSSYLHRKALSSTEPSPRLVQDYCNYYLLETHCLKTPLFY